MNTVEYIQKFPVKRFQRGEILLQKGDPLEYIMAIREGYVKATSICV